MHFSSGGIARKSGFRFELKYSSYLDGVHQENPWFLYISRPDIRAQTNDGTYTERSVRFATQEDAEAFCDRIADGEITLAALKEGEQTAWNAYQQKLQQAAESEFGEYLSKLKALGVDPSVVPEISRLFTGLSENARALSPDPTQKQAQASIEASVFRQPQAQVFGDWFSEYEKDIDVRLVDRDQMDHFLPAMCYLEPAAIGGAYDYTVREKWLLSLPLSHISDRAGCPVAVLKTDLSHEETEFLLGVPQFDSPQWSEISMRAVYAGADFSARLNYLQDGTSFELPFDGQCMDAFDPEKRSELCKLLSEHKDVYIALFPGSDDDFFAYGIEKTKDGKTITSELEVPIHHTAPGKGLTSTLEGKIAWAKHVQNKTHAKPEHHVPMRNTEKEV